MTGTVRLLRLGRSVIGVTALAAVVAAAMFSGVLRPLEDACAAMRFALTQREPSKQIVVVQIDAPSLRAAGRWPWERERFAEAISNLQSAGAQTVGFDVDFSARSSEGGDRAMAEAIAAMPGGVVLPTFVQPIDASGRLVENAPLGDFSAEAVLASVNVPVDRDGRVRRYQAGFSAGETYRQSLGASLAQAEHGRADAFLIDYGIEVTAIPRISFEDVRRNAFDKRLVEGKAVLIGATALELGDEFATLDGVLPGVFVHALAFESLKAGRALVEPRPFIVLALVLAMAIFLRPTRPTVTTRSLVRRHLIVAALALGAPLAVQAAVAVSMPGAPLLLTQALCLAWATQAELRRRAEAAVRAREAGLLHLAMHEPETELPNRRSLLEQVGAQMAGGQGGALAVVVIGLDRYAMMRSAIGYNRCNELVRQVAGRLSESLGGGIAHLSTSVLGCVISAADADELSGRLEALERLEPTYRVDGHAIDVFTRAGVARLDSDDPVEADRLVEFATIALDQARAADRRLVMFDKDAYLDPSLNLDLMSEMARGLAAGELQLHYQPKVRTEDGRVEGAEALIRWRHPERGPIPPDAFIGAAEETGSIRLLTEWTIARALEDSRILREAGHELRISVNLSGRLLADRGFCQLVLEMVGARAGELCLEITETAVIDSPKEATDAIAAFHRAGMKVSIDDYGVGLSSLSYLKMLDADELKIDKSLVTGVVDSQRDRLIFKSTVDLAHSLGMVVVAEGVETQEVEAILTSLRCDTLQGYLISRPVPVPDLLSFLEQRQPAGAGASDRDLARRAAS